MEYNCAYVTLATTPKYLEGAKCLYQTYLALHHKYPFYIMVLPTTDITGYEDLPLISIKDIKPSNKDHWLYHTNFPSADVFNKFSSLLLVQYDYVMFLDADVIINKNIDNLMEMCCNQLLNDNKDIYTMDYNMNYKHIYKNLNQDIIYKVICAQWMILKTGKEIFNKIIGLINLYPDEEILLYILYKNNIINFALIDNIVYKELRNIYHNPFQPDDRTKKYWEIQYNKELFNNYLEDLQNYGHSNRNVILNLAENPER